MAFPDEVIVAAAIQYRPNGFCKGSMCMLGRTHAEIIGEFAIAGLTKTDRGFNTEIQGFWTNKNRFVTREEALFIADHQGQLKDPKDDILTKGYLISECVNYAPWDGWNSSHNRYIPDP